LSRDGWSSVAHIVMAIDTKTPKAPQGVSLARGAEMDWQMGIFFGGHESANAVAVLAFVAALGLAALGITGALMAQIDYAVAYPFGVVGILLTMVLKVPSTNFPDSLALRFSEDRS
jgi:uncharacterized transporter YbjL